MEIVGSLTEMGFPVEACKRAAYQTRGQGLESATQWIMEHMDDPDFLQPFQMPNAAPQSGTDQLVSSS
jgi:ubiquitin carboxyl-terminal hydrolase 5/13